MDEKLKKKFKKKGNTREKINGPKE